MKETKNQNIILFVLAALILCCIPVILKLEWGATFGIIIASICGMLGCLILYLAFQAQQALNKEALQQTKELVGQHQELAEQTKVLAQQNQLVADQFEQQTLDQHFFKLMNQLQVQMDRYAQEEQRAEEKNGSEVFRLIALDLLQEMMHRTLLQGRLLIKDKPAMQHSLHYEHLIHSSTDYHMIQEKHLAEAKSVKKHLINLSDHHQHWEFLNSYFVSSRSDQKNKKVNLRILAAVYFHESSFKDREEIYTHAFKHLRSKHHYFIESYLKLLNQTLLMIGRMKHPDFYAGFLKTQLTSFEKLIIFYYIAANQASEAFKQAADQYDLVDDLLEYAAYLINVPSKEEFQEELKEILKEG